MAFALTLALDGIDFFFLFFLQFSWKGPSDNLFFATLLENVWFFVLFWSQNASQHALKFVVCFVLCVYVLYMSTQMSEVIVLPVNPGGWI